MGMDNRVDELLEANTKLVLENRELKSRLHTALSDTVLLAKELARALRALDGYGYARKSPDVDTKGGFDVVSEQPDLSHPQKAGGTRRCFP